MTPDNVFFFWGGVLSNFHPIDSPDKTSEKVFMLMKAMKFGTPEEISAINSAPTPREAKKLGRKIKGFVPEEWDKIKVEAMMFALRWKWDQCQDFRDALITLRENFLVEASPVDRIWGIGFTFDKAMDNVDKWGQNLLGICLMNLQKEKELR